MISRVLTCVLVVTTLGVMSCADDTLIAPSQEEVSTELTVLIGVRPPTSLRTLDTWNYWNVPINVAFVAQVTETTVADGGAEEHPHAAKYGDNVDVVVPLRIASEEGAEVLVGTVEVAGMQLNMRLSDGEAIWERHHDGELEEHHAESNMHHMELDVIETATGHATHGGTTLSHCAVTLHATATTGDETDVVLLPVQSGHGLRYESNTALAPGTYDLHLEIEPPSFFRSEHTKSMWADHMDIDLGTFVFDGTVVAGEIGAATWNGTAGDTADVSLRAGDVKTYGAVGMGMLPLRGDETINFSLRLQDPNVESHGESLFESAVVVTVTNGRTGHTATGMLDPMYGEHGFHFARNMDLGLGHLHEEHHEDGGHGDGGHP